jgi:hypothetical protein
MQQNFIIPVSLLGSLSFIAVNCIELLICSTFNTSYAFLAVNYLIKNSKRIAAGIGGHLVLGMAIQDNALSGRTTQVVWFPGVKSIQFSTYGAHGYTSAEVLALNEFKATGGGTPLCLPRSTRVDIQEITAQNVVRRAVSNARLAALEKGCGSTKYDTNVSQTINLSRLWKHLPPPEKSAGLPTMKFSFRHPPGVVFKNAAPVSEKDFMAALLKIE